jgi:hypothetical protein
LWCGDTVLKVAFLALFGIACHKDAVVAENLEWLADSFQWNVSFIKEAHDWEVDVFTSFFHLLRSVKVNTIKTVCDGSPPKKVFSKSSPSITP